MQPCTIRLEPAVKSAHAPHPATNGSDLELVQVLLFAEGYEYQHDGLAGKSGALVLYRRAFAQPARLLGILDGRAKLNFAEGARQPVIGVNQMTPCTDVFLWYGDIAPGEEQTRWGHVWIGSAFLAEFGEAIHMLTPHWHERERQGKVKSVEKD